MTLWTHHPQSCSQKAEFPSDNRQKAVHVLSSSLCGPKPSSVDKGRQGIVLRWYPKFLASLPMNCLFRLSYILLYKNSIQHTTSLHCPRRSAVLRLYPKSPVFQCTVLYINLYSKKVRMTGNLHEKGNIKVIKCRPTHRLLGTRAPNQHLQKVDRVPISQSQWKLSSSGCLNKEDEACTWRSAC